MSQYHNSQYRSQYRNIAIVGPYSSGKTTLFESLLFASGATTRKGSVKEGNTIGDNSPEARDRHMSTEVTAAQFETGGLSFTLLDCPGSIEFLQESLGVLVGVDTAIVVCEPDVQKVLSLGPLFQKLDAWEIPHIVFLNKMDVARNNFTEVLSALNQVSSRPLLMRQYPILQNELLIGYIDLLTENAYHYHPNAPEDLVPLPDALKEAESNAHRELLETLAEFDDHLLEELIEDIQPPLEEVVTDFRQELEADLIVPVCLGIADVSYGITSLLKTLLEDVPDASEMATKRGFEPDHATPIAQVLKTYLSPQGGKQSLVRLWQGVLEDSMLLNGQRIGGIYHVMGSQSQSLGRAEAGDIVLINRLDGIKTGDLLSPESLTSSPPELRAEVLEGVYCQAIKVVNRKDEVKLSTALSKLTEEDPSIQWEHRDSTHEMLIWGQGDIHLGVAADRLNRKYHLPVEMHNPGIPYQESIRKPTHSHGRYKHQSGGHGQYGDVYLDIKPQARGEGFRFEQRIVGGVVPKQYIPGVEMGVREYLAHGAHGFPIVDVSVTLTDGSYHSVDSSEQAFKQAARLAMQQAIPNCEPILLEPVEHVDISTPTDFTANVLRLITNRRGQILGYDGKKDWAGWDVVSAFMPLSEMQDLIIELRSLTQGVGFFHWQDDHLEVVPEKIAAQVLATSEVA